MRPDIPRAPLISAGLALVVALGSTQTWARALFIAIDGTDSDRGILTLLAALGAAGLGGWRAFLGLDNRWYFFGSALLALAMFGLPAWFLLDVATVEDQEFFGERVQVVTFGWGLIMTVIVAALHLVAVAWQLPTRRMPPEADS